MTSAADDQIAVYLVSTKAGLHRSCPTCSEWRPVWIGETLQGDILTCCGVCQRVLDRTATLQEARSRTRNRPR